jgi:L-alanine-DL-glutamate epimerase-like enolase superfamily enzyme
MSGAVAAYGLLLGRGFPPPLAAYTPVIATALAIIALEARFPERLEWRPHRPDIKTDLAWIANVRVSKMGGLLRCLEFVKAARARSLGIIVGSHVGERACSRAQR